MYFYKNRIICRAFPRSITHTYEFIFSIKKHGRISSILINIHRNRVMKGISVLIKNEFSTSGTYANGLTIINDSTRQQRLRFIIIIISTAAYC